MTMTEDRPIHFWRSMHYQCDSKLHEFTMWLEDGCEGPIDHRVDMKVKLPWKDEMRVVQAGVTTNGRIVIPVPFTIGCFCGKPAVHTRWSEDHDEDMAYDEEWLAQHKVAFPHFRYDFSENPTACGIPVGPAQ